MRNEEVPQLIVTLACKLRDERVSFYTIAKVTGYSEDQIRRRIDPEYRERRNNNLRERRAVEAKDPSAGKVSPGGPSDHRITPKEALRLLASVPRDTRRLTARLMGDPLPGRSALDRREVVPVIPTNPSNSLLAFGNTGFFPRTGAQ